MNTLKVMISFLFKSSQNNHIRKDKNGTMLKPRQFKNNLTIFESKLIFKLPPFFMHCVCEGKRL